MKSQTSKNNSMESGFKPDSQARKMEASDLDILTKAYELILENSDMFFKELGNAFILEREAGDFNPTL